MVRILAKFRRNCARTAIPYTTPQKRIKTRIYQSANHTARSERCVLPPNYRVSVIVLVEFWRIKLFIFTDKGLVILDQRSDLFRLRDLDWFDCCENFKFSTVCPPKCKMKVSDSVNEMPRTWRQFGRPQASFTFIPRDAPVGHRRGNNPVEYVLFFFPRDAPVGHRRGNNPVEYVFLFPRDAPLGHRRGNNPVEYVFLFPRDALQGHRRGNNSVEYLFIFLPRSHKKQCRILIEV